MRKSTTPLILVFAISVFIFICCIDLSHPGLYYDEVLFINGSLGGTYSDLFIYKKINSVPIMLMPYIGALKSWMYFPIFKIFEINYYSIRLPMILIGALALFYEYKIVKYLFGTTAGIIFVLIASVNPTTVFHVRMDLGPAAFMMLFRAIFILHFLLWINNPNKKDFIIFLFAMLLGIFDKLNFIWIVNALIISYIFTYLNASILSSKKIKYLLVIFIPVIFIIIYFFINNNFLSEIGVINYKNRTSEIFEITKASMLGYGVLNAISQPILLIWDFYFYIYLLIIILSFYGIICGVNNKLIKLNNVKFLFLFLLLIVIQIFITKKAGAPWHILLGSPIWLMLISAGLYGLVSSKSKFLFLGHIKNKLAYFSITVLLLFSFFADIRYIEQFRGRLNPAWDKSSEVLAAEILKKIEPGKTVIFTDWGVATVFQALSNNKVAFFDFWSWFNRDLSESELAWFKSTFVRSGNIFIVSSSYSQAFPATRLNFSNALKNRSWNMKLIDVIKNADGNEMYYIYMVN